MILFLDACALSYRFEGAHPFRAATTDLIAQFTAGQAVVDVAVSRLSVPSAALFLTGDAGFERVSSLEVRLIRPMTG